MPQMSLYIDKPLYMELRSRAKEQGVPQSKLVNDALRAMFNDSWPEGYFDLFGSVDDDSFERPEQEPWSSNSKRETL